jgi:hypothetical protein
MPISIGNNYEQCISGHNETGCFWLKRHLHLDLFYCNSAVYRINFNIVVKNWNINGVMFYVVV